MIWRVQTCWQSSVPEAAIRNPRSEWYPEMVLFSSRIWICSMIAAFDGDVSCGVIALGGVLLVGG